MNSFKNTLKVEDVVQFQLALAADWNCRLDGLTTTMRQHFVSEGSSRSTFVVETGTAHWHLRGQDQDCHLQHQDVQLLLQPRHSGHWAWQQGPNFSAAGPGSTKNSGAELSAIESAGPGSTKNSAAGAELSAIESAGPGSAKNSAAGAELSAIEGLASSASLGSVWLRHDEIDE